MAVKKAAEKFVGTGGEIKEGLLNRVEMAFRIYDPCFSCATHSLPGQMPLTVDILNAAGETIRTVSR
jgi:F420-non-reducing hydrogenase large subunit